MTTKISTPLRDQVALAVSGNFMGATIDIYSGAQPASADDAATGTLLVLFAAINYEYTSSAGTVALDVSGGNYLANAAATGTAGWGRLNTGTYTIDGSVGIAGSGAQFIINTTSITSGDLVALSACPITMPGQ